MRPRWKSGPCEKEGREEIRGGCLLVGGFLRYCCCGCREGRHSERHWVRRFDGTARGKGKNVHGMGFGKVGLENIYRDRDRDEYRSM